MFGKNDRKCEISKWVQTRGVQRGSEGFRGVQRGLEGSKFGKCNSRPHMGCVGAGLEAF